MATIADMFSMLETIANVLLNVPKTIQEQKDQDRRRQLGRNLITAYFRILEMIAAGDKIISELEYFVSRFARHKETNDNWSYSRHELRDLLEKQALNLIRLGHVLQPIEEVMKVISPDTTKLLTPLIRKRKSNSLARLAKILNSGALPTKLEISGESSYGGTNFEIDEIQTSPEWDEITYERVKLYLAHDAPRERLVVLKKYANSLREMLTKHFSLEEILWSVDKFRDGTSYLF